MAKSNKEACKKYREKIKKDPLLYEQYKARRKKSYEKWFESLKQDPVKFSEFLEKEKIRSKNKREKSYQDPEKKENYKEYQKKFYSENKDKIQKYASRDTKYVKNINLARRYGISIEQYSSLIENQNHCCAICKLHVEKLVVDHCHTNGNVRALLCRACNVAIGFLKEDLQIMQNAIEYVKKYKGIK